VLGTELSAMEMVVNKPDIVFALMGLMNYQKKDINNAKLII
jgi:hypothetical protein